MNDTTSRWYGLREQDIMAVICRDGGQQLKKCFFESILNQPTVYFSRLGT